jgi:hypothetical protein
MKVDRAQNSTAWDQYSTLLPLFKDDLLVDLLNDAVIEARLQGRQTTRLLVCMADIFQDINQMMYHCDRVGRHHFMNPHGPNARPADFDEQAEAQAQQPSTPPQHSTDEPQPTPTQAQKSPLRSPIGPQETPTRTPLKTSTRVPMSARYHRTLIQAQQIFHNRRCSL